MENILLEIRNVSFAYKKGHSIFEDLNLDIHAGQIMGLLGKNGTGKSTLLYLMSGLLRAQRGKIMFSEENVNRRSAESLADMFLIPEEFSLPNISIRQYVKLNGAFYPRFSEEILRSSLIDFDLDTDIRLGELSMGQKKKVLVSFALATNTPLLMMDEPTNGLDVPSKSRFRKVVASGMTDEKAIVISTHQIKDVDKILDRITMIDGTRVALNQTIAEISEKFYFTEQSLDELTSEALYMQPNLSGCSAIYPNTNHKESPVDLELLFSAMLEAKEKMQNFLKQ